MLILRAHMLEVGIIHSKRVTVAESHQKARMRAIDRAPTIAHFVIQQFVHIQLPARPAMRDDVFERFELREMRAHLEIRPSSKIAHRASRKVHRVRRDVLTCANVFDELCEQRQEFSRLRWQFIERAAEHRIGQAIRDRDILTRDRDVRKRLSVPRNCLGRALVLM